MDIDQKKQLALVGKEEAGCVSESGDKAAGER